MNLEKRAIKYANAVFPNRHYDYNERMKQIETYLYFIVIISLLFIIAIIPSIWNVTVTGLILFIFHSQYRIYKWRYNTIQVKNHHVIHQTFDLWCIWSQEPRRHVIDVHRIKKLTIRPFWIRVTMQDGKHIRISKTYQHIDHIYAVLKYHRPNERRTVNSTRKSK